MSTLRTLTSFWLLTTTRCLRPKPRNSLKILGSEAFYNNNSQIIIVKSWSQKDLKGSKVQKLNCLHESGKALNACSQPVRTAHLRHCVRSRVHERWQIQHTVALLLCQMDLLEHHERLISDEGKSTNSNSLQLCFVVLEIPVLSVTNRYCSMRSQSCQLQTGTVPWNHSPVSYNRYCSMKSQSRQLQIGTVPWDHSPVSYR